MVKFRVDGDKEGAESLVPAQPSWLRRLELAVPPGAAVESMPRLSNGVNACAGTDPMDRSAASEVKFVPAVRSQRELNSWCKAIPPQMAHRPHVTI